MGDEKKYVVNDAPRLGPDSPCAEEQYCSFCKDCSRGWLRVKRAFEFCPWCGNKMDVEMIGVLYKMPNGQYVTPDRRDYLEGHYPPRGA